MAETRAAERVFSEDILIFYFSLPNLILILIFYLAKHGKGEVNSISLAAQNGAL